MHVIVPSAKSIHHEYRALTDGTNCVFFENRSFSSKLFHCYIDVIKEKQFELAKKYNKLYKSCRCHNLVSQVQN